MTTSLKNATHLFELPMRRYHSSESWWSSIFSMVLLYRSRDDPEWSLATYSCQRGWPVERSARFAPGRLAVSDLIIEARLAKTPFHLGTWPIEFLGLKPDVSILRPAASQVAFIEVKTIGASVLKNHSRYLRARDHLREQGWSADFYYLLSHGHECLGDWPVVEHDDVPLLLWEDILQEALATPIGQLFDDSLANYATRPSR